MAVANAGIAAQPVTNVRGRDLPEPRWMLMRWMHDIGMMDESFFNNIKYNVLKFFNEIIVFSSPMT